MAAQHVVLTDVATGLWVDECTLNACDDFRLEGSADWSVSKRTLHGGVSDGIDVIEVNNGVLSVEVLPTRGMGLWRGTCRGLSLGWNSPVAQPVHPSFVDLTERGGLGWLAGFNELLCRCGLAFNGPPGTDILVDGEGNRSEAALTLHGKIANTPAHFVEIDVSTDDGGTLSVTGLVDEAMMFGPALRLKSTLSTTAGSSRLTIVDEVVNQGGQPAEVELLYHTNLGRPFLGSCAQLIAPLLRVAPRDARAAEDASEFSVYQKPTPGYAEQVYFMELAEDETGETLVLLRNAVGDNGVSLHFAPRELPCFTLWKNTMGEPDGYVTGLEPATNFPNLKTFERQQGRVVRLAPGETYQARLEMAVHASREEVAAAEKRIARIQGETAPTVHKQPQPDWSPVA